MLALAALLALPSASAVPTAAVPQDVRDCQADCWAVHLALELLSQGGRWLQDPPVGPPQGPPDSGGRLA